MGKIGMGIALLLGLLMLANGVFMIASPEPWYWLIPGVPDRGPFNPHFVRDIGFLYMLMGGAFVYGSLYPRHFVTLCWVPTAWLVLHALFHVWEVIVGICGPQALLEDFAGVTLPALLAVALLYTCYRGRAVA